MRTKSAKAKGRRAAAEIRELLLKTFPQLQESDIVVTPSGVTGPDLWLSPAAQILFPYAIESKNQEALNIWDSLKQAESHEKFLAAAKGILFFKRNKSELFMSMKASDFMKAIAK
jgi:hypothetical protein